MVEAKSLAYIYSLPEILGVVLICFPQSFESQKAAASDERLMQYNVTKSLTGSGHLEQMGKADSKILLGMEKLETLSFDSFLETWSERASP